MSWCLGAKLSWCQIVSCHIVLESNCPVPNCPRCQSVWCQIVRCQIVLCQIVLCQIFLCQIVPCQIVLCQIFLCQIVLCQIVWCQIAWCQIVPAPSNGIDCDLNVNPPTTKPGMFKSCDTYWPTSWSSFQEKFWLLWTYARVKGRSENLWKFIRSFWARLP